MSDSGLFAETGRVARRGAQRALLLETLQRERWNLRRTAKALGMGCIASPVLRAIKDLELTAEYEQARAARLVKPGRPATEAR